MSAHSQASSTAMLDLVRRALGRQAASASQVSSPLIPEVVWGDARSLVGDQAAARDRFIHELQAISGCASLQREKELEDALRQLVQEERIRRAVTWQTPGLLRLQVEAHLQRLEVEIIRPDAPNHLLATCDLGVTEADFALPETGTLGLLSSPEKPRQVSLLPRVHLAILAAETVFTDLEQALQQAKGQNYLVLVTGPSRTADIELTLTLGVHGPQKVYAWVIESQALASQVRVKS